MTVVSAFEPLEDLLQGFAEATPGYSGQLCVILHGNVIVDVSVGDLTTDQLTGVYSCSKGAAAAVIGMLFQSGDLDLDAPVAKYWPEFAAEGKERLTVQELLSHRAGLMGIDGGVPMGDYLDSENLAQRLAALPRMWKGNTLFAYHALTVGVVAEELVRRIAGVSLQHLYEQEIRSVHGLDFYLGLPESQEERFAPVRPPLDGWPESFVDPFGFQGVGLNSATGFLDDNGQQSFDFFTVPNLRIIREKAPASVGGVANARGLAAFYATLGKTLNAETLQEITTLTVAGTDISSGESGAFATLFTKPRPEDNFGSWRAFGHAGFNGARGYSDPLYGLAVGYVPLHAELSGEGTRSDRIFKLARQLVLNYAATGQPELRTNEPSSSTPKDS